MDLKDVVELVNRLEKKIDALGSRSLALSESVTRLEERYAAHEKQAKAAWGLFTVAVSAVISAVVARITKG